MATSAIDTQIDFIKSCLRKGEARKKILAKFVKKWQSASVRTFDRRLEVAEKAIRGELDAINSKALDQVEEKAKELSKEILTSLERQVILSQIARGEIRLKKPMIVAGGSGLGSSVEHVDVDPDWTDRKNAIAELNKMDGAYAPSKLEGTIKSEVDFSKLSDEDLAKLAEIVTKTE